MPTKSVATRELQDGRHLEACDLWPIRGHIDDHGDQVTLGLAYMHYDMPYISIRMSRVTIDGHTVDSRDCYGISLFTMKPEGDGCRGDDNGLCSCDPVLYRPLTHRAGKICEECWLHASSEFVWKIRGIGTDGCPHN